MTLASAGAAGNTDANAGVAMRQYRDLLADVLENGERKDDRTGVGTLSVFGRQSRYVLSRWFPLLTTKRVHFKSVVHELVWFLSGETNIRPLLRDKVSIWSDWPHAAYVRATGDAIGLREFEERVLGDDGFAARWGDTGKSYSLQWRRWQARDGRDIDQIAGVVRQLREQPNSRRIILTAWNPADVDDCSLPPCHSFWQWGVSPSGRLHCHLYQRSADLFLGVPFNIASAALLTTVLAHVAGLKLGDLVHSFGDLHIYTNHLDQVREQLSRDLREPPTLWIDPSLREIDDFRAEHVKLVGYNPHPAIKAPVAV